MTQEDFIIFCADTLKKCGIDNVESICTVSILCKELIKNLPVEEKQHLENLIKQNWPSGCCSHNRHW